MSNTIPFPDSLPDQPAPTVEVVEAMEVEKVEEPVIPEHLKPEAGEDVATDDLVVVARIPKTDSQGNTVVMKFFNAAGQRIIPR